jgi:hypothetical protein
LTSSLSDTNPHSFIARRARLDDDDGVGTRLSFLQNRSHGPRSIQH